MINRELIHLGITLIFFVLCWAGSIYIRYLRGKRHNTQLWGTIFEGLANKLINLDAIKEPEIFIEKKAKRSGQGKDDEQSDLDSVENNKQ